MSTAMFQVLIFIFASCGCLAANHGLGINPFDINPLDINPTDASVCKANLYDVNEQLEYGKECLTEFSPDVKLDLSKLAAEERDEMEICFAQKGGFLSKDEVPVFDIAQATATLKKFNEDTDPKVYAELSKGLSECEKNYDPETEGLACFKCCLRVGAKVCGGLEGPIINTVT